MRKWTFLLVNITTDLIIVTASGIILVPQLETAMYTGFSIVIDDAKPATISSLEKLLSFELK